MDFFAAGKTMLRIAVNEFQPKLINPHVPYGAAEVAAAAIGVARAGACIVHFHSRTDDGAQALADDRESAQIYRRAFEMTAAESDIVLEPTNIPSGPDVTTAADVPHFWHLLERPPRNAAFEIVNIDGFRFAHGKAAWDEAATRLHPVKGREIDTSNPYVPAEIIDRTLREGLVPFFGVFELNDVRFLAALARANVIPTPVLVQINFFCDLFRGPTPSLAGLDAFLAEWRRVPIDSELSVFVRNMPDLELYESFLSGALDRGVHIRVGLGDNPHLHPTATNEDVAWWAREIIERKGLSLVTPRELRARVGLAG